MYVLLAHTISCILHIKLGIPGILHLISSKIKRLWNIFFHQDRKEFPLLFHISTVILYTYISTLLPSINSLFLFVKADPKPHQTSEGHSNHIMDQFGLTDWFPGLGLALALRMIPSSVQGILEKIGRTVWSIFLILASKHYLLSSLPQPNTESHCSCCFFESTADGIKMPHFAEVALSLHP